MRAAERLLLVVACALLIGALTFGMLSLRDPGPAGDQAIPPPRIASADLIQALTGETPTNDELNRAVVPTITEPSSEEIPPIVAEALGRFVVEASDGTDTIDVPAAAEFLRGRIEMIRDLGYRDAYAKGLLSTSQQVLSNEAVIATARRTSANAVSNQYFEAYDSLFRGAVMKEARRLDALRERKEQRHRQASKDFFSAFVCLVCLLFVGCAWLLVRHRLRKQQHAVAV